MKTNKREVYAIDHNCAIKVRRVKAVVKSWISSLSEGNKYYYLEIVYEKPKRRVKIGYANEKDRDDQYDRICALLKGEEDEEGYELVRGV